MVSFLDHFTKHFTFFHKTRSGAMAPDLGFTRKTASPLVIVRSIGIPIGIIGSHEALGPAPHRSHYETLFVEFPHWIAGVVLDVAPRLSCLCGFLGLPRGLL